VITGSPSTTCSRTGHARERPGGEEHPRAQDRRLGCRRDAACTSSVSNLDPTELASIIDLARGAIATCSPDVVKQFFEELVRCIEVGPNEDAYPESFVPDMRTPGRSVASVWGRTGPLDVGAAGLEPTTCWL
jgi:hypothetical protein